MTVCFLDPKKIGHVQDVINGDPEFRLAARFFSRDILLRAGESKCIVRVRDGTIREILLNPSFADPWSLLIGASVESWEKFLQRVPPPFYTDLYGVVARQSFEMGGDVEAICAHYWPITRMLDLLRQLQNE